MIDTRIGKSPSAPSSMKILVVEDEAIVSLLLEDMLLDLGYGDVWVASDVESALGLLASKRPDVAVLDVNLGGESAYPVAEQLAAMKIPFVFATGYGRFGIDGPWAAHPVIQKPYDIKALQAVIGSVL